MAITKVDDRGLNTPVDLLDNEKIRFGTGNDFEIYYNGSYSFVESTAGALILRGAGGSDWIHIEPKTDENGILIKPDGNVELYYDGSKKFYTISSGTVTIGHHYLLDSDKLKLGDSEDLQIYADGSNSYISHNGDGNLRIYSGGAESIRCTEAGATHLFHNGTEMMYTHSVGIKLNDSKKIYLGTGNDLQIYHDGSHSYIKDVGTGELRLSTSQFTVQNAAGDETLLYAVDGGAVGLKYADSLKLATTSTGVQINGNDFKYPSGYGLFMAYKSTNSQTLSHNTQTVIQYDTEDRDQQGWYDTSTYKYTPQVAGWYQIFASSYGYNFATQGVEYQTKILKNGTNIAYSHNGHDNFGGGASTNISSIVYLNGSSDYVQGAAYQYNSAASNDNIHGGTIRNTCFYGYLLDAT